MHAARWYGVARTWMGLLLSCCLCSGAVPHRAWGVISLAFEFDNGSLDLAASTVEGVTVSLAGRDNHNAGTWKWLHFAVSGVEGLQPTFQIGDNFASGSSRLDRHEMVYSYDGESWNFFAHNARLAGQGTFVFSDDQPFSQDTVYVAYGLPYAYERIRAHVAQVALSPWVTPTHTANSELVIGQSPGGIDDLGRSIAPRDLFGYRISDDSVAVQKPQIVLLSGVHANESLANHTLEGLVDFLLSDDLEAAILRREAEVFVYPAANPDGRFAGYNRSTVQHEARDPNRFWREDLYADMTDIKVVAEAMKSDTEQQVEYFIDFHSFTDTNQHFGILDVDRGFDRDPFWQELLHLEPALGTSDAALIDWTAQKFGLERLQADFTMTFETEFIPGENVDRFLSLGGNVARALETAVHVFADLNFDGQLDVQDWLLFVSGAETDLTGLLPIEAYERGDLDQDGINSVIDFGLFKHSFEQIHGQGSFASLLANLPEPTGAGLLMWSFLSVLVLRRAAH